MSFVMSFRWLSFAQVDDLESIDALEECKRLPFNNIGATHVQIVLNMRLLCDSIYQTLDYLRS